ncbi:hypothetical protein BsIDN1_07360 [Bacillus safensis]|uniref:Class D sortase n=1 Tax=Bacillus safensis TaxID=561879 RepID=A0A5S9M324_BACIA|nr:hypothetical protein BsIDN1_07360 [Bacillus safensis]
MMDKKRSRTVISVCTSSYSAKKGQKDFPFAPQTGEAIGLLHIPKLKAELPIVEGTDADDLAKGVGHFHESYFPNEHGQIVLSGHRDTVFRRTGELVKGDQLIIELSYGRFVYVIEKTKIVKKDDQSIITLQQEKEELVLTTCYPFFLSLVLHQTDISYMESVFNHWISLQLILSLTD